MEKSHFLSPDIFPTFASEFNSGMTYGERIIELEQLQYEKKNAYLQLVNKLRLQDHLEDDERMLRLKMAIQERDQATADYIELRDIILKQSKKKTEPYIPIQNSF